ncbi:hypothetical protein AB3N02_21995 [Priestia aryabhattai]|uniref:hypothetical protein n=1 Tax=Priestia aryabhattai TaxID=412384 RepID=UPI00399F2D81
MHSYDGKTATFHFDGGLKGGDLYIICKDTGKEIKIDADDVIKLVAYEYVMSEKISKLEQATPEQILLND